MYRWLIGQGFPEGFQVLCSPCNASKGAGPACRLNHAGQAAAVLLASQPVRWPDDDEAESLVT